MRRTEAAIATGLLLAILSPQFAYALTSSDTMTNWRDASDADRSRVLDDLKAKSTTPSIVSRQKVIACMNAAAEIPGHGDLSIADIAEACSQPAPVPSGEAPTNT